MNTTNSYSLHAFPDRFCCMVRIKLCL